MKQANKVIKYVNGYYTGVFYHEFGNMTTDINWLVKTDVVYFCWRTTVARSKIFSNIIDHIIK